MMFGMKILAVECLLLLTALLAVHSHRQLDQRQVSDNLFLKVTRFHGMSKNIYTQWSVPQSSFAAQHSVIQPQDGRQEADQISGGLPGQPSDVEFAQYSGYVTVDSTSGRALFYYFAEATRNASTSPLILWLNGGPGCSSFGYGALQELGPFGVNPDGKTLYTNPYAWNQVANTLFLESPAGVGFSYSNTSSDYKNIGDQKTAEDSYTFLLNWFERFPQYKNRDFYIIGESYAGNYIPELADAILYHKKKSEASFINLKGIMIGNGLMNVPTDDIGTYDYWWTHALISDETHGGIQNYCNFSSQDPLSAKCIQLIGNAYTERGNIDEYNIYAPTCLETSLKEAGSYIQMEGPSTPYDPCSDNYVTKYLNTPAVQKALHANVTSLHYPWTGCSIDIHKGWNDSAWSLLPLYPKFIEAGLRILIYSGDVDSNVPVTATKYSINALKLPIETSWYSWTNDNEVGGYSVIYKGLTFATVRGAGHQVPTFQPVRALAMLKFFLAGKPLPDSSDV